MHKILIFFLLTCSLHSIGQEASVEKSIFGIQTGFLGGWVNHELKLSTQFALRTEVGLDVGTISDIFFQDIDFFTTPVITLEPRWYYNLKKRVAKSKSIQKNSVNFLSVKTSYNPNWFVISNYKDLEVADQISISPTWGIRRELGKNFNYEAGLGVGYRYIFAKGIRYAENEGGGTINIHLRIGYSFN